MALNYNGTSPTAIEYNGTDLTVLNYRDYPVWGKPYSLSISQGANTAVTVTRNSSPNQHASTGALSSGSVVYYGDRLIIVASANSGYTLSTFTVNGSSYTGTSIITVKRAVSVVTTAVASTSWTTVFTGSWRGAGTSINAKSINTNITIPSGSTQIRITGSYQVGGSSTVSFSNQVINVGSSYTFTNRVVVQTVTAGSPLLVTLAAGGSMLSPKTTYMYLTKVEAYY